MLYGLLKIARFPCDSCC